MNLYPATAFIRHFLTARSATGHGVHSPYVFDFLTDVVRGKNDASIITEIEKLRQEMLSDRRTVRVTDLGAGSARRSGEERRISDIASAAALPPGQVALLSRISGSMRAGNSGIILELGTSLGISALALALAAPERRVVTVEGCPALAEIARNNLLKHGAVNAEVINMEFSEALEMLSKGGTTVSLAFIDGNHRGGALTHYTEIIRSLGEEMLIVADDIHLNREMYSAWSSLASPGTGYRTHDAKSPHAIRFPAAPAGIATASLETFRFGILFCIRNLTPGQYRIRY